MRSIVSSAIAGALRHERRISDLIANNLSNVQTAGFKKDAPIFHTILNETMGRYENMMADGTQTLFNQGDIQNTGNPLDLAIEGEGFFKVKTPQGMRYTRTGNFRLSREKVLVNADSYPVMGKKGEIRFSGQTFVVGVDGTIKVDGAEVGRIDLVNFSDLSGLKKEGQTLFRLEIPQAEGEARNSQLHQGALESSNVNPIEEMVKLIDSLRSYESCMKVIQSNDEMDGRAVNELGRV